MRNGGRLPMLKPFTEQQLRELRESGEHPAVIEARVRIRTINPRHR